MNILRDDRKNKEFLIWFALNIGLPLCPLLSRFFISTFSIVEISVLEVPELLFYSIVTCVIALNVFQIGKKGCFITFVNIFLIVLIVLNIILYTMYYLNVVNDKCLFYAIVVSIIPTIISPIYKYKSMDNIEEGK